LPVKENLTLLATYRDNAVHFYNEPDFGVLIYALAQTSIVNLKDLMSDAFEIELERDISWQLMPLGLKPPIDPINYISRTSKAPKKKHSATKQFLAALTESYQTVENSGGDAGRLMTVFQVRLESVKKIEKADLVVGVAGGAPVEEVGPLIVTRVRDPNVTHPLRRMDLISKVGSPLQGLPFTTNTFEALAYKFKYKTEPRFCWQSSEGVLTRYSADLVRQIRNLSKSDIEDALNEYRRRPRRRY